MRTLLLLCAALAIAFATASLAVAADIPANTKKQTTLGKYVTSVEAYAMVAKGQAGVVILDVRTPQEYDFVGHPAMAYNIPAKLWSGTFNAEAGRNVLADNPDFVSQVKAKFQPTDTLLVLCRSGDRSAVAVNTLAAAGFVNAYSVVDGFEGDTVTDSNSPNFGKRAGGGWKNSSLPWTYDLDEKLVYVGR